MLWVSTRNLALLFVSVAIALAVIAGRPPTTASAAPPSATSEVSQTPPAGSAVALGTPVTYVVTVTLVTGQATSLTIQMTGDADITNRTLTCTSSSNGSADVTGPGGAPSCMWTGPVLSGTFTFTFAGTAAGPIANLLPGSVVCTDNNSTNTCNDEPTGDQVPLSDSNGDVGPIALADPPQAMSQVDQVPPAGSVVPHGTRLTYTVTVTVIAGQTLPLTIQLRGQMDLINLALTCTSTTNGPADVAGPGGDPSCMWNAPVVAGTFTFTFAGDITGAIDDAVPTADSVVCTDTNANNSCADEALGNQVALADSDGDVGPVTIIPAPDLTSEVNQAPDGGTVITNGTRVTYTVTVTLVTPQSNALTIQLRGDANLNNRALTCTSTTNGGADVTGPGGSPSCIWFGPVAAGVFTFTFAADASGPVGDAVPATLSIACADLNASNTCTDESPFYTIPLVDADGDAGALLFQSTFKVVVPLVAKD